ncbi:MAG: hypothetical protein WAT79_16015 [Saprospiraceae bacterium]
MKKFIVATSLLFILLIKVQTLFSQDTAKYFTLSIIDQETGRGVPMVELRTRSRLSYFTDSNGIIAFNEPTLMNQFVSFKLFSHGYEGNEDGIILNTIPGTKVIIRIKRLNIAERLYRITGQDIYGHSTRVGLSIPIKHQALNGKVMGQDTYIETLYKGKLYWFWGDTESPNGFNGEVTGATSELPNKGGLDPGVGIDLNYFTDENGFIKHMCPYQGQTLVWIQWLVTLNDEKGDERLYALYKRINRDGNPGEAGFVVFNDSTENFDRIKVIDEWYGIGHRSGHPFFAKTDGQEYMYIINHTGIERVRADIRYLTDPASYELFTCFAPITLQDTTSSKLDRNGDNRLIYDWKSNGAYLNRHQQHDLIKSGRIRKEEGLWQMEDFVTGNPAHVDPASVFWNDYKKRWIMIAYEFVGGVWFFEGDTPTGPWVYGRKIVAHDNYDFYNVGQHPLFDQDGGRLIYFEGTYTKGFSQNTYATPLYDYNQMMYRLALDDQRLSLPAPVYLVKNDIAKELYLMREVVDSLNLWEQIQSIPFFAIPNSTKNDDYIPVYASESEHGTVLSTLPPLSEAIAPLFYALPEVAIPRSEKDPITGTWKCNTVPEGSNSDFELRLEFDGEKVIGSYETVGYFKNDTLRISSRIDDFSLTGKLNDGILIGEYRKDDGTEMGVWSGTRQKIDQDDAISSSVVFLYEYRKVGGEEHFYSIDPNFTSKSYTRIEKPICRVWKNPLSVLALDYKAKPIHPVK